MTTMMVMMMVMMRISVVGNQQATGSPAQLGIHPYPSIHEPMNPLAIHPILILDIKSSPVRIS